MTLFKCQMYLARTALIGDTFQIELEFRNVIIIIIIIIIMPTAGMCPPLRQTMWSCCSLPAHIDLNL